MAPPRLDLLFHPKKKPKPQGPPIPPVKRPNSRPSKLDKPDDDEDVQLPDTPFQEFRLLSSALNGWKYDVMRFDSRKPVDIYKWHQPVKLNRKDLYRSDEATVSAAPKAVGPMLGPDGKPVIGPDGKLVMVDAEGRPIQANGNAPEGGRSKDKGKAPTKKKFQKKTRQVFPVPEEVRQLRKEERYPWVIEDSSPSRNETWIAQMEDLGKAGTHAFFMPAANEVFKFVPSHRWYKFQKKLKHDLPTDLANVESLYNMNQKRDPQQWLAARKGKAPSAATIAMFKAEEGRDVMGGSSMVINTGQSLGPGGRRLKMVDNGMNHLFDGDDDEEGVRKRRARELGEDGDMDEQVYEEEFADDDEHADVEEDDEDAKEAKERIKKEYRAANKRREAGVDETDDEGEDPTLSKQAKAMQKIIRNREGNDAYDSDDERNPYASSEEEEEEEPVVLPTATAAIQEQQKKIEARTENAKATPQPRVSTPGTVAGAGTAAAPAAPSTVPATATVNTTVNTTSPRPTSPILSPSHSGHSVLAKRATSPHFPKPKAPNIPNGSSLLAGPATAAQSKSDSSPVVDGVNGDTKVSLKRKAETPATPQPGSTPADAQPPKAKKRKAAAQGSLISSAELESMLFEWLKTAKNATTRDCIQHFTPYLVDMEKKTEFSAMVRKHATLKNGVLVRKASSSPSSTPAA